MIRQILRSAAVFMLLLTFLAGSTGISFYIHTCGSSHKKEAFAFREIFHQKVDCCCEENPVSKEPAGGPSKYNDEDCCRISHLFIKAPFLGFPVTEKLSVPVFCCNEYTGPANYVSLPPRDLKASNIPLRDPSPPPLSGMDLVCFLHQIRIPAPAC